MLRRLASVLVVIGLVVAAGLGTPPAASAVSTTCRLGTPTLDRSRIAVGSKKPKAVKVRVKVTNCSPKAAKRIQLTWWVSGQMDGDPLARLKRTYKGHNTYVYEAKYSFTYKMYNSDAGEPWLTEVAKTKGTSKNSIYTSKSRTVRQVRGEWSYVRASRLGLDVWWRGSKKPPRGYWLYVNPYLERVDWQKRRWVSNPKNVTIQFKPSGGKYRTIGTAPADGGPSFFQATEDGCYRAVYRGSTTTAGAKSKPQCIDVA